MRVTVCVDTAPGRGPELELELAGVPRVGDEITLNSNRGDHLSISLLVDAVAWHELPTSRLNPGVWLGTTVVQDDQSECTWEEFAAERWPEEP